MTFYCDQVLHDDVDAGIFLGIVFKHKQYIMSILNTLNKYFSERPEAERYQMTLYNNYFNS